MPANGFAEDLGRSSRFGRPLALGRGATLGDGDPAVPRSPKLCEMDSCDFFVEYLHWQLAWFNVSSVNNQMA